MRKLAFRYRRIKEVYDAFKDNVPGNLESLRELYKLTKNNLNFQRVGTHSRTVTPVLLHLQKSILLYTTDVIVQKIF